jgi:hypothetical protein
MTGPHIYRTEQGTVMRISEDKEGRLSVELLQQDEWAPGPVRMAGLRLADSTKKLTAREIRGLPG